MHAVAVRLIIEDLEGATTIVNLGNEDVTIGRKPHNTIQLTEQNVSRSHAKLIFQDDGWLVHDLSSYNGVKVNGVQVNGPAIVREGDMIQIGDYHLTLSDDVDRATVDIERPRVAANDGVAAGGMGMGMGGGMGASASSELPSVSVEDLPPMRPPNMGPGESAAYRTDSIDGSGGQQSGKNTLLLVALGVVGLIAVAAVTGLLVNWKGSEGTATDGVAQQDQQDKAVAPADADPVPEPQPVPGTEDGGGLAHGELVELVESDSGELVDDEVIEDDPREFDDIVETDGGDEPTPKPKPKPKPTQDKAPAVAKLPPAEALAEARKASLKGDNRNAYALAKDAYDQNKSSEALSVMGIAACKMGSVSKAKAVYKKMTAEKDKQTLEKICKPLGVELQ